VNYQLPSQQRFPLNKPKRWGVINSDSEWHLDLGIETGKKPVAQKETAQSRITLATNTGNKKEKKTKPKDSRIYKRRISELRIRTGYYFELSKDK
jgi:hypothetical protein